MWPRPSNKETIRLKTIPRPLRFKLSLSVLSNKSSWMDISGRAPAYSFVEDVWGGVSDGLKYSLYVICPSLMCNNKKGNV